MEYFEMMRKRKENYRNMIKYLSKKTGKSEAWIERDLRKPDPGMSKERKDKNER